MKTVFFKHWVLFSICLLGSMSVNSAYAQITVFPGCDFNGSAVTLPEGDYTTDDLRAKGIADNSIASVIVPSGYAVQLYTKNNFSGSTGRLVALNRCLDHSPYEKNISSLSIFKVDQSSTSVGLGSEAAIEVFSECNYRGQSVRLQKGKYSAAQLRKLGLADNTLSSLKVPDGMTIELYENDFFRGNSGTLGANSECLVKRFNDQVSSVVVKGEASAAQQNTQPMASLPPIEVFNRCDYSGTGIELPIGDYNAKDLVALGIADNSIASLRIPSGVDAVVFENDFQRGKSKRIADNERCLSGSNFERSISSISVAASAVKPIDSLSSTRDDISQSRVTIFTDCNYKGRFAELPVGEYDASQLRSLGFRDNAISALKVGGGLKVTIYENDGFAGGQLELQADENCLKNRRADDAISSLIVESRRSDKPFAAALTTTQKLELDSAFKCIKPFVDRQMCDRESWSVISKFCALSDIELMNDGYFEGHVNAGNCTTKNWTTLQERVSDTSKR